MQDEIVIVIAAGARTPDDPALALPPGSRVIAADGGLDYALALGFEVETVVGDLDSVDEAALARAAAAGARVVRHPTDKDATDLELALDEALALQPGRILVLASDRGRLDHLLGALLLLASPRYAGVDIEALVGAARVHVIRGDRELAGEPGELISLLALHGPADRVSTEGLLYALDGETLEPGSSRGISNVFTTFKARIHVGSGVVVAIVPTAEGPEPK